MTRLGLALAAAAALAALPHAAMAQRATGGGQTTPAAAPAASAAPGKVDPKQQAAQRTRGMKEAPPLVAASGAQCQITDALYKGEGKDKGADGKEVKITAYEVACSQGFGYIVVSRAGQPKPQAVNCIMAQNGGSKCELPQNTDFKAAITPAVKQAGRQCDVTDVRYVGSTATPQNDVYEVGCAAPSLGFMIGLSADGQAPTVNDCVATLGTSQECKFTPKAAILTSFQPLVAKTGKTCQVSDFRSIGRSAASGEEFTEIACSGGTGFVLVRDKAGAYKNAIDCGKAQGVGDGCKLTDVTVAQTQEAGTYTKLAAKAGFPCDVGQYRVIGMDAQNREVVELKCKNRTDGAVALFDEKGSSRIYDCVRAGAVGGSTCKLSEASVVYPKYTAALAAKGRATCKVSNAAFLAHTTAGSDYIEAACADGAPGWVMSFKEGAASIDELLTCRQATGAGLKCKLAGNTGA